MRISCCWPENFCAIPIGPSMPPSNSAPSCRRFHRSTPALICKWHAHKPLARCPRFALLLRLLYVFKKSAIGLLTIRDLHGMTRIAHGLVAISRLHIDESEPHVGVSLRRIQSKGAAVCLTSFSQIAQSQLHSANPDLHARIIRVHLQTVSQFMDS